MSLKKIYANVVDYRVIDDGQRVEDCTSFGRPNVTHPTTTIKGPGMVADIDVPNMARVEAMEAEIAHNNGVGCQHLKRPGKHNFEFRIARQRYNVTTGEMGYESVKVRLIALHKSTESGKVETDNPMGDTEKYSILRYEEEINGEVVTLIDTTSGKLMFDGVDYSTPVNNLLD